MNTYLLPICYPELMPEIITVIANSLDSAEDKFMEHITRRLDTDETWNDWEQFIDDMLHRDCYIGEIYDKDQF